MKKKKLLIIGIILLTLIIIYFIFRNISFGTDYIVIDKTNSSINISIPKYTFDFKESDNNISIKSFQSNRIIKKVINNILSNYEKTTCNNKEYYYSEKGNYTIIDYGINNHFIFNTIYIKYVDDDYCENININEKAKEYGKILGEKRAFGFYSDETNKKLSMAFYTYFPNTAINGFRAELVIGSNGSAIEASAGYFTIENDKLIYTRTNINEKSDDITIPETSTFTIVENGVFKLDDNYLNNYASEIILK